MEASTTAQPDIGMIGKILSEGKLEKLRAGFDEAHLNTLFERNISGVFNPASAYVNAVVGSCYAGAQEGWGLAPADRERCLIALLASKHQTLNLAIHCYVGLSIGLSVGEITTVLLLSGVYGGVDAFTVGISTLATALTALEKLEGDPLTVGDVYAALKAAF